jgi:hypothetical protein
VLSLGGMASVNALAATDSSKEGGIGGTGSAANIKGIGGTGAPAANDGIGGTGAHPNSEPSSQALAGRVLFIAGPVEAQNPGMTRLLAKGDAVRAGDTLKSGKDATMQLRMEDGGTIVLRPESQLVIESFAYNGAQDGSEHMSLALLSGGFRAVTGNIGKLHKENYSIHTPNARIGILGTDHEAVFIPGSPEGKTAGAEPGTYDHVISGATMLQSKQGKLLIQPNQTGFAALNGTGPIILDRPMPLFGDSKSTSDEHREGNSDIGGAGKETKHDTGSMDPISDKEQHNLTQSDLLANSSLDLNTFVETDATPAEPGSAVVGAQIAGGLLTVGSAQAGSPGQQLLMEEDAPSNYSNDATGFNFNDHQATQTDYATAQVDGVDVSWGLYAGGIAFDTAGNPIAINFHPFAFVNAGATPASVISSIGGTAAFSTVVGNTQPVTETGNTGGSMTLNVGIDLDAATVTSYNLGVTDANSRNWTGSLGGPVALSTFANGMPLSVTCSGGSSCGSGSGSGSAAGMLIGPSAKGLISSYVLSTTTGQAVAGAVVMSRP